jgi:hypothetical protein
MTEYGVDGVVRYRFWLPEQGEERMAPDIRLECDDCRPTYVANVVGLPCWAHVGPRPVCMWIEAGGGEGPADQKPWTTHTELAPDSDGHWVTGIFNGYYYPQELQGFYKSTHAGGSPAGTYLLTSGESECPGAITIYGA